MYFRILHPILLEVMMIFMYILSESSMRDAPPAKEEQEQPPVEVAGPDGHDQPAVSTQTTHRVLKV